MKNWETTILIRQKHTFLYHQEKFYCWDIILEDYLLYLIDPEQAWEKILTEFNTEIPKINKRQQENLLKILFNDPEEEKDILKELTETQKRIKEYKDKKKSKKQSTEQNIEKILADFHITEWQMCHYTHNSVNDMRKWPYQYFFNMYNDIPIIIWTKEYDEHRNSNKPDKKKFKDELSNFYN